MRAARLDGLVIFVKAYGTGRIVCVTVNNTTVVRPRIIVVIAYRRDNVKTQTRINGDAEAGGRFRICSCAFFREIHRRILIHNTQNWLAVVGSLEFLVRKRRTKKLKYRVLKLHKVYYVCTHP